MDQQSIIEILESNGFQGRKECGFKEECTVYEQDNYDSLDIIINGVDLYVNNCNYVKFEVVDKWGLCIRLYYDYNYVGCITNAWEDIKEFNCEF